MMMIMIMKRAYLLYTTLHKTQNRVRRGVYLCIGRLTPKRIKKHTSEWFSVNAAVLITTNTTAIIYLVLIFLLAVILLLLLQILIILLVKEVNLLLRVRR